MAFSPRIWTILCFVKVRAWTESLLLLRRIRVFLGVTIGGRREASSSCCSSKDKNKITVSTFVLKMPGNIYGGWVMMMMTRIKKSKKPKISNIMRKVLKNALKNVSSLACFPASVCLVTLLRKRKNKKVHKKYRVGAVKTV